MSTFVHKYFTINKPKSNNELLSLQVWVNKNNWFYSGNSALFTM